MQRKTLFLSALTLSAALIGAGVDASAAPLVGQSAPAFSGTDTSGQKVSLEQYRGKTVVLEWTNPECPYVRKHYGSGNMQSLQKDSTSRGVIWLTIDSSAPGQQGYLTAPQANQLTKDRGATPTRVLLDPSGGIGRLYNARTTPHMFIIDPTGQLVYMGGIDDKPTTNTADVPGATNFVRAALEDMAAGRPVATPVTRPYGCSIKYAS